MARLPRDVQMVIQKKAPRALKRPFEKEFKKRFLKVKSAMIKEFLSHPVTIELMGGPSSSNTSGTLGGISNLFAFIGFDSSDKPIEPILQILENMNYNYSGEAKIGVTFYVNIPEAADIFKATPMPWASGRSWAKGIETGISGLGYLLRKDKGRSGKAIQSKRKVRSQRFQNTQYISALIKKYKKEFNNIK
jgi:hypothetical protein